MKDGEKIFDCDKCGLCCRNLKKTFLSESLNRGDGVCKNFDEKNNLCKIYHSRPLICNVDAYYEKFLRNVMTREKFHELNREVCEKLKGEFQK